LAISSAIAEDIRGVAPRLKALLLENCIDTEHFQPADGDVEMLDRLAGFTEPTAAARVGLVATYAYWKGHDVFLEAVKRLPHLRSYIIGGPLYSTEGSQWSIDDLRQRAQRLGISDRVGFVPFQTDPRWVYRSLDIVVHASTRPEPFGLTIAEALACGRAVVVAAAGGAKGLFTEGQDALGHEPGSVDSLVEAIDRLASDAALRERLGQQARQTAIDRFSTAQFGHELIEIYEGMVTGTATR
jgi:glycosyltransferase involved in cell wall biosynthesis